VIKSFRHLPPWLRESAGAPVVLFRFFPDKVLAIAAVAPVLSSLHLCNKAWLGLTQTPKENLSAHFPISSSVRSLGQQSSRQRWGVAERGPSLWSLKLFAFL
jgi:hypothetical protein